MNEWIILNKDPQENHISHEMCEQYGFAAHKGQYNNTKYNYVKCESCGQRFKVNYIGSPLNERMQTHADHCPARIVNNALANLKDRTRPD